MRITCPHCGNRSLDEFVYYGDASLRRPDFASPTALNDFIQYAYQRTNVNGAHRELWYHSAGCHAWLVLERNVTTHEIKSVELARDVVLASAKAEGA